MANHALTLKFDHSSGADHDNLAERLLKPGNRMRIRVQF
jgi:hypothetical protein